MALGLFSNSSDETYTNLCCCKPINNEFYTCCSDVILPQTLKVEMNWRNKDWPCSGATGNLPSEFGTWEYNKISFEISLKDEDPRKRPNYYWYEALRVPVTATSNLAANFFIQEPFWKTIFTKTIDKTNDGFLMDFNMFCSQGYYGSVYPFLAISIYQENNPLMPGTLNFSESYICGFTPFNQCQEALFINCQPYLLFGKAKRLYPGVFGDEEYLTNGIGFNAPGNFVSYYTAYSIRTDGGDPSNVPGPIIGRYRPSGSFLVHITE